MNIYVEKEKVSPMVRDILVVQPRHAPAVLGIWVEHGHVVVTKGIDLA